MPNSVDEAEEEGVDERARRERERGGESGGERLGVVAEELREQHKMELADFESQVEDQKKINEELIKEHALKDRLYLNFENLPEVQKICEEVDDEIYNLIREMLKKLKLIKSKKIKTISNKQKIFKKLSKKALLSDKILYIDCNISQYFLKKYSKYLL